jgi:hypothetical protein
MADLTHSQRLLADAAVPLHFSFGGTLAATVVVAQGVGTAPGANKMCVLRRVSAQSTGTIGATGNPAHISVQDGSGGATFAYLTANNGSAPAIVGSGVGYLGIGTANTQMVIYVGANLGATGNYTGNYVVEGEYVIIPVAA